MSRFLLDENVPASAATALRERGHEVVTVANAAPGASDEEVLDLAIQQGCVIVTFDKDFGELAFGRRRTELRGVVLFRMRLAAGEAGARVAALLDSRSDWNGHFSVLELQRVRMRPL